MQFPPSAKGLGSPSQMQNSPQPNFKGLATDDDACSTTSSTFAGGEPKRRTMYIKTYKSDSDDELQKLIPVVSSRPQRSSKPNITDLRDQMRYHSFSGKDAGYAESIPITVISLGNNTVSNYVERSNIYRTSTQQGDDVRDSVVKQGEQHSEDNGDQESSGDDDSSSSSVSSLDVPIKTLISKKSNQPKSKMQSRVEKDLSAHSNSPYYLFFRDTQTTIKSKKPHASFGEINRIVTSMWDNLDPRTKADYRRQSEAIKSGMPMSVPVPVVIGDRDQVDLHEAKKSKKNGEISSKRVKKEKKERKRKKEKIKEQKAKKVKKRLKEKAVKKEELDSDELDDVSLSSCDELKPIPKPSDVFTCQPPPSMMQRQKSHDKKSDSTPPKFADFVTAGPPRRSNQDTGRPSKLPLQKFCLREGCSNLSISDHRWDHEFCSTECCCSHALDVIHVLSIELSEK